MKTLFVLYHDHNTGVETDNTKLIGIYSSQKKAMAAIARFRQRPGFCNYPDGFLIDEYQIDNDYWAEGFVTEK